MGVELLGTTKDIVNGFDEDEAAKKSLMRGASKYFLF